MKQAGSISIKRENVCCCAHCSDSKFPCVNMEKLMRAAGMKHVSPSGYGETCTTERGKE